MGRIEMLHQLLRSIKKTIRGERERYGKHVGTVGKSIVRLSEKIGGFEYSLMGYGSG